MQFIRPAVRFPTVAALMAVLIQRLRWIDGSAYAREVSNLSYGYLNAPHRGVQQEAGGIVRNRANAGGAKGLGIGVLVGAGVGLAGGAFTGNKDIVLPAETMLSFKLLKPVDIKM